MVSGSRLDSCRWVLTVPATLPPAEVQMFPLGFRDPFGMRQPRMRGAAVAPVAQRKKNKALKCILLLVLKLLYCLFGMFRRRQPVFEFYFRFETFL